MNKLLRLLALATTFAAVSLHSLAESSTDSGCTLRVGWDEWYPFMYLDASGKFSGSDYNAMMRTAKAAGCELQFHDSRWAQSLEKLAAGDLDMLFGASKTEEREKFAQFSLPYRTEFVVLVLKDDQSQEPLVHPSISLNQWLNQPNATGKQRVLGIAAGAYYGSLEAVIRDPARKDQLYESHFDQDLHKQLRVGKIDGYLVEASVVQSNVGVPVKWVNLSEYKVEPLHFMFSKKVPESIVQKFNKALGGI